MRKCNDIAGAHPPLYSGEGRKKTVKNDLILLENETEANLLGLVLKKEEIPFFIREYTDPAFEGLRTYRDSWGAVDAPKEYRDRIREILNEIRAGKSGSP